MCQLGEGKKNNSHASGATASKIHQPLCALCSPRHPTALLCLQLTLSPGHFQKKPNQKTFACIQKAFGCIDQILATNTLQAESRFSPTLQAGSRLWRDSIQPTTNPSSLQRHSAAGEICSPWWQGWPILIWPSVRKNIADPWKAAWSQWPSCFYVSLHVQRVYTYLTHIFLEIWLGLSASRVYFQRLKFTLLCYQYEESWSPAYRQVFD